MHPIAKEFLGVLGRAVGKAGLRATDSVLDDIGLVVEEADLRIKKGRARIRKIENTDRPRR
jgi:hypothetical protein